MCNSFKLFIKELFSGIYSWASLLLFLLEYVVKHWLPETIKKYIDILPMELVLVIIIILILIAAFKAYHMLSIMKLDELYRYRPEANKDRIFRIFYELYKEGEFLRQTPIERRQAWDERVLRAMKDNCESEFQNIYLLNTGRRYQNISPLQDKDYETALERIKELLDQQFHLIIKS